MATNEKPCPWHAETLIQGRLRAVYCEVGPEEHDGSHIGERTRDDYLNRLRKYLADQNRYRRSIPDAFFE